MRRVVSALLAVAFVIALLAPATSAGASPPSAATAPAPTGTWVQMVLAELWLEIAGIVTPPAPDAAPDGKPAGGDTGPGMDPNG
jgi:hypothetical protein